MTVFYNEFDSKAAAWLRELISAEQISTGVVDERSITELIADDVRGHERVHLFAGIGGWDYALQLAGWTRPVWTGSCPCQPFSCAGKRKGATDERHLWPEMFKLIRECRPGYVFGEQVSSAIGHGWLDGVFADLEAEGYACGACVLGAHSVGAPHIRQRLYWVAYADTGRRYRESIRLLEREPRQDCAEASWGGSTVWIGHANVSGLEGRVERVWRAGERAAGATGAWDDYRIIGFRDGKTRRIESLTEPLVDGLPGRVGLLRGYGNAIVPQVAAAFIRAFMEAVA